MGGSMFKHCGVEKMSGDELDQKMYYLGRLLGIRVVQERQAHDESEKARKAYYEACSEKSTVMRDMEAIGIEIERRNSRAHRNERKKDVVFQD